MSLNPVLRRQTNRIRIEYESTRIKKMPMRTYDTPFCSGGIISFNLVLRIFNFNLISSFLLSIIFKLNSYLMLLNIYIQDTILANRWSGVCCTCRRYISIEYSLLLGETLSVCVFITILG